MAQTAIAPFWSARMTTADVRAALLAGLDGPGPNLKALYSSSGAIHTDDREEAIRADLRLQNEERKDW